jgi:hypothetical protein
MSKQADDQKTKHGPSRLLIAEPPLLVLPSLAKAIGLNEAIFLQQLHYWLQGKSGKARDGRLWVYNTYEEWAEQLPFWSIRTIRRIVGDLESRGLVISTSEYNTQKMDRTKWYSLDYVLLDRLTEPADHVANVAISSDQDADLTEPADHVANLATSSGQNRRMDMASLDPAIPETSSEINIRRPFEDSKDTQKKALEFDDRILIGRYLEDFARELDDQAPLSSSTTRAVNLYLTGSHTIDSFIDIMLEARRRTQASTASIRTKPTGKGWGRKPKMAYFFGVLEDLLTGSQERSAD